MSAIYERIANLMRRGETGVLITVVAKGGSAPASPGTKLLLLSSGERVGTVGGGSLEHVALKKAQDILQDPRCLMQEFSPGEEGEIVDADRLGMICGGNITLFFAPLGHAAGVYLFGAGHIGRALASHLRESPFRTVLLDTRGDVLEAVKWHAGADDQPDKIHVPDYASIGTDVVIPDGSYVVIATHSHDLDYRVLRELYAKQCRPRYIGVVASRRKARVMVEQLAAELNTKPDLSCLYMPVGLDIGGGLPQEISISIVAEILCLHYGKSGLKHLRQDWSAQ